MGGDYCGEGVGFPYHLMRLGGWTGWCLDEAAAAAYHRRSGLSVCLDVGNKETLSHLAESAICDSKAQGTVPPPQRVGEDNDNDNEHCMHGSSILRTLGGSTSIRCLGRTEIAFRMQI